MSQQTKNAPAGDGPVERRVRPQCLLLSPWFPASVQPARPGIYEVGHDPETAPHPRSRYRLTGHRRMWDGITWRAGWLNEKVSIFGTHPSHQWRGVLRPNV